jgi:hypothetical protein
LNVGYASDIITNVVKAETTTTRAAKGVRRHRGAGTPDGHGSNRRIATNENDHGYAA